jgi:predicted nucleotidyltransferase
MEREDALRRIRSHFAPNPGDAAAVWLFGSVARGEAPAGSDADLALLLRSEPPPGFAGLLLRLEGDLERSVAAGAASLRRLPRRLDQRLGEPRSNRELFDRPAAHGWIPEDLCGRLRDMAGFRDVVVHGHAEVDPSIVRDVVEHHLGDLEAFVAAIRRRL